MSLTHAKILARDQFAWGLLPHGNTFQLLDELLSTLTNKRLARI
jgi:hypothetical protein